MLVLRVICGDKDSDRMVSVYFDLRVEKLLPCYISTCSLQFLSEDDGHYTLEMRLVDYLYLRSEGLNINSFQKS